MRALVLTKYGPRAASTRYRFLQYLPILAQSGIDVTVSPLLDDTYLEQKLAHGRAPIWPIVRGYFRRVCALMTASWFDIVVVHCELFPYWPAWFERMLRWRKIPYVLDFDDAIFHNYDLHRSRLIRRVLGQKMAGAMAGAARVIAGNEYLAAYARRVNSRVDILPTVVDSEHYSRGVRDKRSGQFTIGWIGSPTTAGYLKGIEPALETFFRRHSGRLVLVGSGEFALRGVPVEIHPWSESAELAELSNFDIGVMPLPDTPWTRGKCGFKLVQYMAVGLPVVASPVGVNATLVEHGTNGLLATDTDEWVDALSSLFEDEELRVQMGAAGRQKVAREYSLQCTAPRLVRLIQDAAAGA